MKKRIVALAFVLVTLFFAVFGCTSQNADFSQARQFVHSLSSEGRGIYCSSVALSPSHVLTADHCANIPNPVFVTGSPAGVPVARGDERLDIALLFAPGIACPCVRLATSEAQIDEPVYVVGYPRGIAQVVTHGQSQGVHDNSNLPYGRRLVVTALVQGGNSGGGVFVYRNGEFQLVGILVEAIGNLSFAVPLADIQPFLAKNS